MIKIKICGLTKDSDIDSINRAGPDYAGFVFAPSKRQIGEEQARHLIGRLRTEILPVGVFQNADEAFVLRLADSGILRLIQLHGSESPDYIRRLRERVPLPVIKAISVGNQEQERRMEEYREAGIAYFLFDQGGGGTGKTFDWNRMPVQNLPFFLAGGLHRGNITEAMKWQPAAVDISSGVEVGGEKNEAKIMEMVECVRKNIE